LKEACAERGWEYMDVKREELGGERVRDVDESRGD